MFQQLLYKLYLLPIVLFSLSIHELCHGYAAYKLGDDTAKSMGRLTINPLAHLDILGTIAMLFFGFGWAKPVPVNFSKLKYRRLGPILVSIAGPLSNILLAFICYFVLVVLGINDISTEGFWGSYLLSALIMNVTLAAFNLIPIPPLDGSKVVISLLPYKWQYKVYSVEIYIQIALFALLYIGALDPVIAAVRNFVMKLLFAGILGVLWLFSRMKNLF